MENASNALIIAGGMLVGILIISLAVYLFIDFGTTSAEVHEQKEIQQLVEFNSQFTVYEGRTDLTIHDIVTIAGYALENNEYYGYNSKNDSDKENYISVTLISDNGTTRNFEDNLKKDYNARIADEQMGEIDIITYRCVTEGNNQAIQYDDKGRVKNITFRQNKS